MEAFSVQTIAAVTDVITGGSGYSTAPSIGLYRTGTQLVEFFRHLGLELRIASRVPSVRELLDLINSQPNGQETLIRIIEQVTDPREYLDEPDKLTAVVSHLNKRLALDGFELRQVSRRFRVMSMTQDATGGSALREKATILDLESVKQDFERALAEHDPEDSITSACSLVESVCKSLLDLMSKPYPSKQDIQGLTKEVAKHLELSPERPDLAGDVRQILGGLATVAGGIGALRTHAGDAHGRGKKVKRVDVRIARFAVNAACTISVFFIETWQRRLSNAANNVTTSSG